MTQTSALANTSLLELVGLEVVYDGIIIGLHDVSLAVPSGGILALLGPNGAGKSTTLKAASGLLGAERGEVRRGTVSFQGRPLRGGSPSKLVREGLAHVLEGRHCFPHLTVEENLAVGGYARRPSARELKDDVEKMYGRFPRLRERRNVSAGHLSGGEQQMLAIGRALMGHPKLVLLDEPSMGLAPKMVDEIFALVRELHTQEGVSFLLAEQNAGAAFAVADAACVLENGRVVASGTVEAIRARDDVQELYLGRRSGERIRYRVRGQATDSLAAE
jgi:branched-chain amino acid transport system ATP-binding protein